MISIRQPPRSSGYVTAALEATTEAVVVVDDRGTMGYASPAAERVLGTPIDELVGRALRDYVDPADRPVLVGLCADAALGRAGRAAGHIRLHVPGGGDRWADVEAAPLASDEQSELPAVIVVLRDVEDLVRTERELARVRAEYDFAAVHDAVTGLPNRAHLERRLGELCATDLEAALHTELLMVKVAAVDELRGGHGVQRTDAILRALGRAIRSTVTPRSFVAVAGPGEFVILNPPWTAETEIARLAEHLLSLAALPVAEHDERTPSVSLALAVGQSAVRPDRDVASTLDQLLRAALASVSTQARAPVRFRDLVSEVRAGRRRFGDVERALAAGELGLHFQPIRDVRSGRICGFEGLVRWHHPTDGVLTAAEFLPAVEGTSLIVEIGDAVLAIGCDQLARWQRRFGPQAPSLAINVSARELRNGDLSKRVERQIARTGVDPTGLCLEFTEIHVLDREPGGRAALEQVRALGVAIALDDFGGGYASLTRLPEIAADVVKIDRSVVMRVGLDAGATAIVRAAIDLGVAFGMTTVAEGVSTIEQHRLLVSMGCDRIQGFLIAPALPADVAEAMLLIEPAPGEADAAPDAEVVRARARLALIDASYIPSDDEVAALAGVGSTDARNWMTPPARSND